MDHLSLETHVRFQLDTGKKCGQDCHCISYLRTSVRIHNGEKCYKYKECGKAFYCSLSFGAHMRAHIGKVQYICK